MQAKHPDEIHVDYLNRYYRRVVKRIIPKAIERKATKHLPEQLMLIGKDLDKGKITEIPMKAIHSLRPVAAAALVMLALTGAKADAHSWYPPACCGQSDCAPLPDGSVKFTSAGWLITGTGETIPFVDTQQSQDEHFHRCHMVLDGNKTRKGCFFAPGPGS